MTAATRAARHNERRRERRAEARRVRQDELAAAVRHFRRPPARVVQVGKATVVLGSLAASGVLHPFAPDGHAGSMCVGCFGWRDDPRHVDRLAGARRG